MSARRLLVCSLALALGAAGACDIPTDAPLLDNTWQVPADETRIEVAEFLPDGVSVTPDGSAFDVDVDPFSFEETLGDLCADCQALDGTTAPKPAFQEDFESSVELPGDVVSVTVESGVVEVVLRNGLGFDPIRPGAGNTGTLTVTLLDGPGGRVLDEVVLDGATDSVPAGSTTTLGLDVEPGPVGTTVAAVIAVDSPEGDSVEIDTSEIVGTEVSVQELLVSSADVRADGRGVDLSTEALDVENVDASVIDAVQSGGLVLDVTNPFGAGVEGALEISGPTVPTIRKSLDVSAEPTSTTTLSYTGDELRSFLGQPDVVIGGAGTVTAPGPVTVTPDQVLTLESTIEAVLRLNQ